MIRDTLGSNALPENFTEETLDRAVAQAAEWNEEKAVRAGRSAPPRRAGQVPRSPSGADGAEPGADARTDVRGTRGAGSCCPNWPRTAGRRWPRGRDDEFIRRELAGTLLAIPAMGEAATYLQEWIAVDGPDVERLGMLAWALGCTGEYGRGRGDVGAGARPGPRGQPGRRSKSRFSPPATPWWTLFRRRGEETRGAGRPGGLGGRATGPVSEPEPLAAVGLPRRPGPGPDAAEAASPSGGQRGPGGRSARGGDPRLDRRPGGGGRCLTGVGQAVRGGRTGRADRRGEAALWCPARPPRAGRAYAAQLVDVGALARPAERVLGLERRANL